ncbi:MAG: KH domain-containing protein [Firmicutes bacterium]|nr:KH domain-containing protein [Bacillota bacterium]
MLNKVRLEGKNKEEILNKYLEENNLNLEEIYIKEEETEAKLFKSKKVLLEIVKKEDVKKYIKEYIKNLGTTMGIVINSEIREKEDHYEIMLISDNNNIIIGKDGKTLNAIQLLLHQAVNNQIGFNIRISVDVSNYKDKKVKRLEREIRKIMKDVLKTKIEVKLDPMNSYERRIVHTIVSEKEELETESFGEKPNRYVVIRCKEK